MTSKKKPIIGIPGWKTDDGTFGIPISYYRYAAYFGMPRILTMEEPIDERLDLIIIPGGADVNPERYGQMPHFSTSRPDIFKEYFDTQILPKYIEIGTPIFGICRGIQTLAVLFGAQLIQNITGHKTNISDRADTVHALEIKSPSFREELLLKTHKTNFKVNSLHHQCVSYKGFPDILEVLAFYPDKDHPSIEAIRHKTLPIYAVQYHPEELMSDPLGDFIIEKLISMSKNYE